MQAKIKAKTSSHLLVRGSSSGYFIRTIVCLKKKTHEFIHNVGSKEQMNLIKNHNTSHLALLSHTFLTILKLSFSFCDAFLHTMKEDIQTRDLQKRTSKL